MDNLEQRIEQEAQRVKPMVYAKVGREDREDVMQDIRLSFYIMFPHFHGNSKLLTYAHAIARNRINDHYRERYRDQKNFKKLKIAEIKARELKEREVGLPAYPLNGGYYVLSRSQKAVLRLVGEGMSNKEIAETLYISVDTVRSHLKEIYCKFQYQSRTKLALFAYRFFKEKGNEK